MKVSYVGPLKDYSGYGEANRHTVAALMSAGVDVVGELLKYTAESSDFGELGKIVNKSLSTKGEYDIRIMHTTPDEYQRLMKPGKYHIGQFYWETDKVPQTFAKNLNLVDEIWTGSHANVSAMKFAGVTKPIYVFPQATETNREFPEPYIINGFDGFVFYSIFEWIDRKNPEALLRAFYKEFKGQKDVALVIKTYFRNFTLNNKRMIKNAVLKLKAELGVDDFPAVFLYLDLMDRRQIMRLHSTGDCFVSAHRGEGWGVPQVEAALAGNAVISTGYGGVHEYFEDNKTAMLPNYKMVQLSGMAHSSYWYTPEQKWAEIDPDSLQAAMRWAYNNQDDAKDMGKRARDYANENFSFETVGKMMAERLDKINQEIKS